MSKDGLLKPEEFYLFEVGPAGAVGERLHFGVGEGAANGEARVVANHGVADDEGGEQPDAEGGESAAGKVDAGGANAADPGHFLKHGERVLFREVMQGEAAEGEVSALVAEGELASVGLDEEHFLGGGRGMAGDLERLKLEIDGDDGDVVPTRLGEPEQVASMVAVTRGEVDEEQAAGFVGQFVEDGLNGFASTEGAVEAGEVFQIAAEGVFVLVGQIHQLGLILGKFTLHSSENAHSCGCVTAFLQK